MFVCSLEGVLFGEDRRVGVVRCAVCGVSVGGVVGVAFVAGQCGAAVVRVAGWECVSESSQRKGAVLRRASGGGSFVGCGVGCGVRSDCGVVRG